MSVSSPPLKQGSFAELKRRLIFVALAILIFRVGAHIPLPGLDPAEVAKLFTQNQNNIIGMFNMFSGGALKAMSVFALGIMPYISASIIMQLFSVASPSLAALRKEGEAGRRKISQYTRYATLVLACFQALGMSKFLVSSNVALEASFGFYFVAVVSLVTGTMFLMWLGEQVTERGIGNGISLIIFAGIVSGIPGALGRTIEQIKEGQIQGLTLIFIALMVFTVTAIVVFIEQGQRRIPIHYAKRQQGRKMYGAQTSHLPLKVNMAGVIPPIFAFSIISFPATIAQFLGQSRSMDWLTDVGLALSPGRPLYILAFMVAIFFFSFFYTSIMFNPRETADNLKKSGAFIPGIRPGEQTAHYVDNIMTRLTLFGASYLILVALLPEVLRITWDVPFYFGGTSLLIVVVVVLDFISQIQALLMSQQYDSLLKKANLSGRSNSGQKPSRLTSR